MKKGLLLFPLLATPMTSIGKNELPNILFCIADDASRESFGTYGSVYCKTPAIDALASKGVVFTNAYTQNPKSAPSRACIVTGKYSWQLKEATNHFCHFPAEFKLYPQILMDNGYHVGFTGKGWGPGTYDTKYNPAGPEYNKLTVKNRPAKGISNTDYAGNFEMFLNENKEGKPFCFWLGCKEPHRFYEKDSWKKNGKKLEDVSKVQPFLPDNDIIKGDLLDYAIEVEWYDKHVGKAIEILKKKNMLDNTIIIITSDHGMPFPRIKGQIYDEGFHIPFIVYWKGKIMSGRTVSDFIGFHDIAPTILEAANVKGDFGMTGKSFLNLLTSDKNGRIDKTRDHMILCKERHDVGRANEDGINLGYPVRAIRTDDFLYVVNYKPERWPVGNPEYGYRNCDNSPSKSYLTSLKPGDKDYSLYELVFGKRPKEELYLIKEDPHCINNVAENNKYKDVKIKLRKQMEKELKESGDPRMFGKGDIFDTYKYVGKPCDYSKPEAIK